MLRDARTAAMTGRTAASEILGGRRLWAVTGTQFFGFGQMLRRIQGRLRAHVAICCAVHEGPVWVAISTDRRNTLFEKKRKVHFDQV
jgi:hypothetical protein